MATTPLSIYVVFHPKCDESRSLAEGLFRWFRLQHDDGEARDAGLPVWYRCRLGGGSAKVVVPEIKYDEAHLNVVVVLASDTLVRDPDWRRALDVGLVPEADDEENKTLLLPVAVDGSAYRLAFLFSERQAIRVGRPRPEEEGEPERKVRLSRRLRLLRRAVTEVTARTLRRQGPTSEDAHAPSRLKVFISHAKRDGTQVAEEVRDSLAKHSQMEPWYDANELPPGFEWDHPIASAAAKSV